MEAQQELFSTAPTHLYVAAHWEYGLGWSCRVSWSIPTKNGLRLLGEDFGPLVAEELHDVVCESLRTVLGLREE